MIVDLITKFLYNNPELKINISLCNNHYKFGNDYKIIKIGINFEHTLVKKGGRNVPYNTPIGKIIDDLNISDC